MTTMAHRRLFAGVWTTYFTVCLLAFSWPFATFANSVEPRVAGFPFFFTWYLVWIGVIFAGGVVMYVWDGRLPGRGAVDE